MALPESFGPSLQSIRNVEVSSASPAPAVPLNVVVCLKQIPNPDLQFQVGPDGRDIKRDTLTYKTNGSDEYALEEAVRLKEKHGGRVVALTAGPKRAEQMLSTKRKEARERDGFWPGVVVRARAAGRAARPPARDRSAVVSRDPTGRCPATCTLPRRG